MLFHRDRSKITEYLGPEHRILLDEKTKDLEDYQADIADEELMVQIAAGDKQAFSTLMARYRRKAISLAYRYVGDFDEAEDMAQDSFVKVYQNASLFDRKRRFSSWFYTILINACRDRSRQMKRRSVFAKRYEEDRKLESILETDRASDNSEMLKIALAKLSPDKREILALRLADDLSYEEIAGILKVSLGTVMSRLFRAKKELEKILRNMGAFER